MRALAIVGSLLLLSACGGGHGGEEASSLEGRVRGGVQGLVVSLNEEQLATPDAAGDFHFDGLRAGDPYVVRVRNVPADVECTVAHGTGVVQPEMPVVEVDCASAAPAPGAPVGLQASYSAKAMTLTWIPVAGASHYLVLEDPDGPGPLVETQVARVSAPSYPHEFLGLLHTRLQATFRVQGCAGSRCGSPSSPFVPDVGKAIGYFKASTVGANDQFGYSVALSGDGSTIAVGAYLEDGAARGVNGNQSDKTAPDSGAVYVFTKLHGLWTQQAYLKASNTARGDNFGWTVALSESGDVLAIGALREDGASMGVNGNQDDRTAADAGAVYVFRRDQGNWHQDAYLKASNTGAGDNFGTSVSISADGRTLAVGAFREDSGLPASQPGAQGDNSAPDAGAAYVFSHSGIAWTQDAYIKAGNPGAGDFFGVVSLSGDGQTLAVGAQSENSDATGIDGDQHNVRSQDSGAVYVFDRAGTAWSQAAYVKASNTGAGDNFGIALAISRSGDILVVGAPREDSHAAGQDGDGADNSSTESGAAYVFERANGQWRQAAYVKAQNNAPGRLFGFAVAISGDGTLVAVCAPRDNSGRPGINADPLDTTAASSGAVHVLRRHASAWTEEAFLKAGNPGAGDQLGGDVFAIGLSPDGHTLAVGARLEDSSATGIDGDGADNGTPDAGALYVY